MVKYYGVYSNKSRGLRKKEEDIQKSNECNDISEIDAEINKLMFSKMKRKKFNTTSSLPISLGCAITGIPSAFFIILIASSGKNPSKSIYAGLSLQKYL